MKILIVDDEPLAREALFAKINQCGGEVTYEVIEAGDGNSALRKIETERPDLVLADIQMPGLSGIELVKETRRLGLEVDFVFVSGYAEFEYARAALATGVHRYLLKPVVVEELRETLTEIVNRKTARDRLEKEAQKLTRYQSVVTREKQLNACLAAREPFTYDDAPPATLYQPMLLYLGAEGVLKRDRIRQLAQECLPVEIALYEDYTAPNSLHVIGCHEDNLRLNGLCKNAAHELIELSNKMFSPEATVALGKAEAAVTRAQYSNLKALLDVRFYKGHGQVYSMEAFSREQLGANEGRISDFIALMERYCQERKFERAIEAAGQLFHEDKIRAIGYEYLYAAFFATLRVLKAAAGALADGKGDPMIEELNDIRDLQRFASIEEIVLFVRGRLLELMGLEEGGSRQGRQLARAIKLAIDQEYANNLQVKELAWRFGINQSYLSILFKQEVGQSLSAYLQKLRLEKACALLRETNLPIADIAPAVGYNDPQYFYRVFRKAVGCTAMEWRRRER